MQHTAGRLRSAPVGHLEDEPMAGQRCLSRSEQRSAQPGSQLIESGRPELLSGNNPESVIHDPATQLGQLVGGRKTKVEFVGPGDHGPSIAAVHGRCIPGEGERQS